MYKIIQIIIFQITLFWNTFPFQLIFYFTFPVILSRCITLCRLYYVLLYVSLVIINGYAMWRLRKAKTMNIDAQRHNTRELCELTLRRNNVDLYSVRKQLAEASRRTSRSACNVIGYYSCAQYSKQRRHDNAVVYQEFFSRE